MIRNDVPAENYSYDVKTVRTYSKQNLQLSKIKSTYAKTKKKVLISQILSLGSKRDDYLKNS